MLSRRLALSGLCAAAALGSRPALALPPRFPAAVAYARARGGGALLVSRNAVPLVQDFSNGAAADRPERLGEATRLFGGILAAALVRDRLLEIGEPAAFSLGDWGVHPRKQRVTVRDLLTNASGLARGEGVAMGVAETLALEPVSDPGAQFIDDPANLSIFGEIARKKVAKRGDADIASYLARRVFSRIGAAPAFATALDGAPLLDDGAALSPLAWMDVGELLRRGGVWRARQVLDGQTVQDMARSSGANPRYGMGFWLPAGADALWPSPPWLDLWRPDRGPLPSDLAVAAGESGARLYVVPSRALVAVRFGPGEGWSDADFLRLLFSEN